MATITSLRTKPFKGMKNLPNGFRSYVEGKHCPGTQLDPKYLLAILPLLLPFLKRTMTAVWTFYWDRAMNVATAVIQTFGNM
ncbi:hypothetical protein TNCV_4831441 [Trichonephila clavipes]|nr:hypothetical protein TNCV_4831441 [Trichonephila clavipes]